MNAMIFWYEYVTSLTLPGLPACRQNRTKPGDGLTLGGEIDFTFILNFSKNWSLVKDVSRVVPLVAETKFI